MLHFGFSPTPDDFLKAYRAYHRGTWKQWIFFPAAALLVGAFAIFIFSSGGAATWTDLMIPLVFFLLAVFYLLFAFVINPHNAAKRAKTDAHMSSPVQYEVTEEQIAYRNEFVDSRVDWGSFQELIVGKDILLLVASSNKRMFQFIPRRAFASAEEERAFIELAQRKLIPPKKRFDWQDPTTRTVVIAVLVLLGLVCLVTLWSFMSFM